MPGRRRDDGLPASQAALAHVTTLLARSVRGGHAEPDRGPPGRRRHRHPVPRTVLTLRRSGAPPAPSSLPRSPSCRAACRPPPGGVAPLVVAGPPQPHVLRPGGAVEAAG